MIVLNRNERFDNLIANGFENKINKRDLMVLAREYAGRGVDETQIKTNLIDFCNKWVKDFNYSHYEGVILSILNETREVDKLSNPTPIVVFKCELDSIKGIEDKKLARVYFIMLCLAKFKSGNHIYLNSSSSIKLEDIYKLARVEKSKKNQWLDMHELYKLGYIDVDLKPLDKYTLNNIAYEGEVALEFMPSESMIENYLLYTHEATHCEICGKFIIKRNNKTKYCSDCAKKVKNEQNKTYYREKQ